jgi:DNA-binding transcriptional MocR family regulator
MLAFVPVTLDLYRSVRRHLHWTLQNLVSFTDRDGRCWPSIRTLSARTGTPKTTIWRHLRQLAEDGVIARQRRPGGVYAYVVDKAFLPAARGVSHRHDRAVPPVKTEEKSGKKTGFAQARFAKRAVSFGEMPDERAKWEARLRSWRQSRFWLPLWGPRPDQHDYFAPIEALQSLRT